MPPSPDWVKALRPSGPQGHELLAAERDRSTIPIGKLSEFLFTKEQLDRKRRILQILENEKVFDKSQNYFGGRIDRFECALARAKRLQQLKINHGWTHDDFITANELISEPGPYGLHEAMFLVTLREQGTPEQHERFLRKAENYEIIGCYAQTELGHGSNVRGLETTATWLPQEKCFVLHSPHLTASKWWIGSLGRTANHAIVMAQLVINGKKYGPHPFVVQIRDLKTHLPLENVHVGDIGPKFGYNTMDNGFLLFNNVKIPHISMLARFSRVDPNTSKYVRPSSPSLVYGTLTWIRSSIVMQAGSVLARGVTIAIRYCAIRRQFQDRDAPEWEKGENQVLNYSMVQIRLLTLLAACYALHFTGHSMIQLYRDNQKKMNQTVDKCEGMERGAGPEETHSGSDLLADLHATSCGLKSLASTTAAEGLEVCRRACGGHGYSSFSGIGPWYADYLPTTTWEGDNYMITQQVARYLLKSARAVLSGNAPNNDTTRILKHFLSRQGMGAAFDILGSDSDIVAAFAWRTAFLTFEALKHRDEQKKGWNDLLVDFYRLSKAHSQYLVVKNFLSTLEAPETQIALDNETQEVMRKLFRLYALHTLEQEGSEFYSSSAVTVRQITLARTTAVMRLLKEIRPHAVRLVDAWDFPDWQLDSSLGRYDGKVYEDMFHRASELNPLNDIMVDPYPNSDVLFKDGIRSKKELPPQGEYRQDVFKRVDVSNLALQRMETFLWGGSSKGVGILGNLTIYSSDEHERILDLERVRTYIQSIFCTDSSVNVTFNDEFIFASAHHAWDWVNRRYNRTLIVIVGGGDFKKWANFDAARSSWQQITRTYDLHLTSIPPDHHLLQRRSGIGNLFKSIGHDIKSVFGDVASSDTQIAATVISDITSGAVNAVNTMVSAVTSVETSVISEVTSHAAADLSVATSVAHSLATSVVSEVKAAVTGALANMMNGGILVPFNLSVPSYKWSTRNGDLAIELDCSNCGVSGGFDIQFHVHGNWSNVLDLDLEKAVKVNITLLPHDISLKIEPEIFVSANISGVQANEQQLLDIPLWEAGGLRIPNVLSIGPHGVVSLGYEVKDLNGIMNISTGTTINFPNDAHAELLLKLPLPHVSTSNWHASISNLPFDIEGRLQGELKIYAKAELQIQAEGMGNGFDAYINLQPYIGANISLTDCKHSPLNVSNSTCIVGTSGHQLHFKAIPSVGGNFNAGAARAGHNGNPLISTAFASVTKIFPAKQFGIGSYGQTRGVVPVMTKTAASSSNTNSLGPAIL